MQLDNPLIHISISFSIPCRWEQLRDARELLRSRQKPAARKTASARKGYKHFAPTAKNLEFSLQDSLSAQHSLLLRREEAWAKTRQNVRFDGLASPAAAASSLTYQAFDFKMQQMAGNALDSSEPQGKKPTAEAAAHLPEGHTEEGERHEKDSTSEDPTKTAAKEEKADPVRPSAFANLLALF